MKEFAADMVNNDLEGWSDADFEELISGMRADLVAAGLEVPAVEEATE